ncbi:hypothetical protein PCE1_000873 [Barthelona sp. PCE]
MFNVLPAVLLGLFSLVLLIMGRLGFFSKSKVSLMRLPKGFLVYRLVQCDFDKIGKEQSAFITELSRDNMLFKDAAIFCIVATPSKYHLGAKNLFVIGVLVKDCEEQDDLISDVIASNQYLYTRMTDDISSYCAAVDLPNRFSIYYAPTKAYGSLSKRLRADDTKICDFSMEVQVRSHYFVYQPLEFPDSWNNLFREIVDKYDVKHPFLLEQLEGF